MVLSVVMRNKDAHLCKWNFVLVFFRNAINRHFLSHRPRHTSGKGFEIGIDYKYK